MHNGTCINNNGSYVCECIAGWQGHHCEDGNFTVRFCGSTKYLCIFIVKFFLQNKEFRSILQVNCCKNNILKIANN